MYRKWKAGQITEEECKKIANICTKRVRKAKVQNELRFVKEIFKKTRFFNNVRSKRKNKGTVGLLHREDGELPKGNREKAELLNSYFTSVFSQKENSTQFSANEMKETVTLFRNIKSVV